ncbi:MAG: isopentenyl-diphosphate Delta-isomerase [Pseudomonadota bacterium]
MSIDSNILVPLVDFAGNIRGYGEKMAVHRSGELHLAFSVMLYRVQSDGIYFLLQKRANTKYHSGDTWSNTCCSHPLPHETIRTAAKRRLKEELGIEAPILLRNLNHVIYRSELDNGMIEHEFDIVVAGQVHDLNTDVNLNEVSEIRWWSQQEIEHTLLNEPNTFTAWFKLVYERVEQSIYPDINEPLISNA